MTRLMQVIGFVLLFHAATTGAAEFDSGILFAIGDPSAYIDRGHDSASIYQDAVVGKFPIELNLAALLPTRSGKDALGYSGPQLPDALWFNLPGFREPVEFLAREVFELSPGVFTYVGSLEGEHAYLATFTYDTGTNDVSARFHMGPHLYLIDNAKDSRSASLTVIEKTRMPSFECEIDTQVPSHTHSHSTKVSEESFDAAINSVTSGNVRLVFYYTPEVASNNNINQLINDIVSEMNASLYASGVDPANYISEASRVQTSVNFNTSSTQHCDTGCCSVNELLIKMGNKAGVFSSIDADMSSVYADLAFLLVSSDCNRLGGGVRGTHGLDSPRPYAVVTDTFAMSDLTAIHEIGHLLGSGHESTAFQNPDPLPGAPSDARGFLEPDTSEATWQTMMGGYQTDGVCDFDWTGWPNDPPDPSNQNCVRLPVWSNPNKTYGGKATGAVNSAHNVEAFHATMPQAAGWGAAFPHSSPSAPSLTSTPWQCYGFNQLDWSSPSQAEHFQLFVSKAYSQGWERVFHGIGTAMSVNVPQYESWDYRVRACNASGCGDFSNVVTPSYIAGCL